MTSGLKDIDDIEIEQEAELDLGTDAPAWAKKMARAIMRTYKLTVTVNRKIESRDGLIARVEANEKRISTLETALESVTSDLKMGSEKSTLDLPKTAKGLLQKAIEWAFIAALMWALTQSSCGNNAKAEPITPDSGGAASTDVVENVPPPQSDVPLLRGKMVVPDDASE